MTKRLTTLTLAALMGTAALPAFAQSKGDITLGFGIHSVTPDGSNSRTTAGLIDVDANIRPTLTAEYFIADRLGVELLVAWPFEHDINLVGTGEVAKTKHLPPTLSLQYHFTNQSNFTPFVGAGLNYTYFFDDRGVGPLAGTAVDLDDSWGYALHAGVDYAFNEHGSLRADIRYIDIETDVKIGGAPVGKVKIDPWVFGVAYVHKF
ncbi:OmpW family outer membrane protein [uncultured Roseovarius sp.]|uniref:OmpW/AlkL family protein n=1 Tax=uncultured Roseovarius sp. TaxID=293344 RepID=UPI00261D30D7|nr:OmpW family outer membrane protein [uncultured Roseovarius sp.]